MWDWLRLRRRQNRAQNSQPEQVLTHAINAEGNGINRLLTSSYERPFLFAPRPVITRFPPKCIGRLPCSEILYGERLEDFSSDCWLENHLHRFGLPESSETNTENVSIPFAESHDDSTTGSDTWSSGYSQLEMDFQNTLNIDFQNTCTLNIQPRLALEELFIPLDNENQEESSSDFQDVEMPPPYSPFEEPPPTYEEAVGSLERRSIGSLSSSSSAFMW